MLNQKHDLHFNMRKLGLPHGEALGDYALGEKGNL